MGSSVHNPALQSGVLNAQLDSENRFQRFSRAGKTPMSRHAYARCWLHVIWGTYRRQPLLQGENCVRVSRFLLEYAQSRNIYMLINHVNADHVHALVDLPKDRTIENLLRLLKGSSSHWVSENRPLTGRFSWGRGYAALSVSQSNVSKVAEYVRNQDAHHRKKSFREEIEGFVRLYGLQFVDDEEGEDGGNR